MADDPRVGDQDTAVVDLLVLYHFAFASGVPYWPVPVTAIVIVFSTVSGLAAPRSTAIECSASWSWPSTPGSLAAPPFADRDRELIGDARVMRSLRAT